MKAPCKGCTNRFAECHSFCEGYKKFRAELDTQNEQIRKKKYGDSISTQFSIDSQHRMKRSIRRPSY